MSHNTAMEAHEHTEHAEHAAHAHDPFVTRVAITVAVLAVCAALASSLETIEGGRAITASSEAVLQQDRATDDWNEYQADSLKKHIYGIAADGGGPNADRYRKLLKENVAKQAPVRARAEEDEKDRDRLIAESGRHEERHHWLTGAAAMFEIGIALSTVAIITHRQMLWLGAAGLGILGAVLGAMAYLG